MAALVFVFLFGRSWNLGNCFHFSFLLFIRRRRHYTYKLKKLARRQDISISREKIPVHYTSRLLRCLLVCSADFLIRCSVNLDR